MFQNLTYKCEISTWESEDVAARLFSSRRAQCKSVSRETGQSRRFVSPLKEREPWGVNGNLTMGHARTTYIPPSGDEPS